MPQLLSTVNLPRIINTKHIKSCYYLSNPPLAGHALKTVLEWKVTRVVALFAKPRQFHTNKELNLSLVSGMMGGYFLKLSYWY